MRRFLIFLFVLSSLISTVNADTERITRFDSTIRVREDAYLDITEEITVYAGRININRGIYREIPTDYNLGLLKYNVDLKVISVKRDGRDLDYLFEKRANGYYIEMAEEGIYLNQGYYTFTLKYEMGPMIGSFDGFDEVYQNITGNDWAFVIEKSSATMIIPKEIEESDLQIIAYTGYTGDKGSDYIHAHDVNDGETLIKFTSTRPLYPEEGLTVAVGFPKGIVQQPSVMEYIIRVLISSWLSILLLLGFLFVLAYYFIVWFSIGRDPQGKVIYPRFKLDKKLDPMTARMVNNMGYDPKVLVSGIIELAVKGLVTIEEKSKGNYTITRTKKDLPEDLSKGEKKLYSGMFKLNKLEFGSKEKKIVADLTKKYPFLVDLIDDVDSGNDTFTLRQSYSARAYALGQKMKDELNSIGNKYFSNNASSLVIPIIVLIVQFAFLAVRADDETMGSLIFLGFILTMLGFTFVPIFKNFKESSIGQKAFGIFLALVLSPFFIVFILLLGESGEYLNVIAILATMSLMFIFYPLIKARTIEGRKIQDEIDGFKMFLNTTEPNRLKVLYPDLPLNIGTYERYLPFAVALGLEKLWSDKFAKVFNVQDGADTFTWYHGTGFTSSSFTSSFSSGLSSSISSSSSAPGSSSGGGGGGGSGGGGGGGGGGGV